MRPLKRPLARETLMKAAGFDISGPGEMDIHGGYRNRGQCFLMTCSHPRKFWIFGPAQKERILLILVQGKGLMWIPEHVNNLCAPILCINDCGT